MECDVWTYTEVFFPTSSSYPFITAPFILKERTNKSTVTYHASFLQQTCKMRKYGGGLLSWRHRMLLPLLYTQRRLSVCTEQLRCIELKTNVELDIQKCLSQRVDVKWFATLSSYTANCVSVLFWLIQLIKQFKNAQFKLIPYTGALQIHSPSLFLNRMYR